MKIFVIFRVFYLIIATFLFASLANAQDNFKGIIPLITTREEIEKKIGKPNEFGRYEFDEGRVYIHYRENECVKTNQNCYCLVPLWTVLSVNIYIYYDLYIKDLKLDPTLFEKSEVTGHVSGITVYVNYKAGISYKVQDDEKVYNIEYFESEKTCKMLEQKASQKQNKQ